MLRDAFVAAGVPTDGVRSARAGVRRRRADRAGRADRPRLPPRARQRHPRQAGRVQGARRRLRRARRLHGQFVPLQARAQEGVLRRAHRSASTSTCSRPRSWPSSARTSRGRACSTTSKWSRTTGPGDLLELARAWREHLVLKPNDEYGGKGVHLGWEMTEARLDRAARVGAGGSVRHVDRAGADSGPPRSVPAVRRARPRAR